MKKWLKIYLSLAISILLLIIGFNFLMDPLWCFEHKNSLQAHQEGFDERQQKLNLIYYKPFKYDGLLLGSSRITLHDSRTFQNKKIFNMAVDGMRPYEFNSFVEYAKKRNGRDFQYIILGLDFMAIEDTDENYTIDSRIALTEGAFYRYGTLASWDTLNKGIRNFKNSVMGKYKKRFKTYNEFYIASSYHTDPKTVQEKVENYRKSIIRKKINYKREMYISTLQLLKKNNPNTKFIVFTTPLPRPLIETLFQVKDNHTTFKLWIHDVLTIFGPFYSFYSINPISDDYTKTFMDAGHYYPEVGECINRKIFESNCSKNFENFGEKIHQYNIQTIIKKTLMNQDKIN